MSRKSRKPERDRLAAYLWQHPEGRTLPEMTAEVGLYDTRAHRTKAYQIVSWMLKKKFIRRVKINAEGRARLRALLQCEWPFQLSVKGKARVMSNTRWVYVVGARS